MSIFYDNKSMFINPSTHPELTIFGNKQIFLAGPIQGAPDWQKEIGSRIVEKLNDIVVTSPRCDGKPSNYENQVKWETHYLYNADIILFYIPDKIEDIEGRCYAQTTGFEMGEWIAKAKYLNNHKKIVLSMSDNYPLKRYVETRVKNMRNDYIAIADFGIDSTINCLCDIIKGGL